MRRLAALTADAQIAYNGAMSLPLIATKLMLPPSRPGLTARPALQRRLDAGLHGKLTLISAPAGFGKTTLALSWVRSLELPVAWLALDGEDGDPRRFLRYFVAAVDRVAPGLNERLQGVLDSTQTLAGEAIITAVLNHLAAQPQRVVLLLDDYHLVEAAEVDQLLSFLLAHQPPQLHLLITTREDPNLSLARLRARNQLTELRASDLRFSLAEATTFLNQSMGLTLSSDEVVALEERTEGWITGLQLAALALQRGHAYDGGTGDPQALINSFRGSHHFVLDYLVEEVLQQQPPEIQTFLLRTSILERLSGPLCAALLEHDTPSSQRMLAELERANLLLIPLDAQRSWYRYHHLFGEVLRNRLLHSAPDLVPQLHQRAAGWLTDHGLHQEGIQHALAAGDFPLAADLLEMGARRVRTSDIQERRWMVQLARLPEELIGQRPVLAVYRALGSLAREPEQVAHYLQTAQKGLAALHEGDNVRVVNSAELASLPGVLAVAQAYFAGAHGDLPAIAQHAQTALEALPETDYLWRGAGAALLGLAYWTSGDFESAYEALALGASSLKRSGDISSAMSGRFLQADCRLVQGRLTEAERLAQDGLTWAPEADFPFLQGSADLMLLLAEVALTRFQPERVEHYLERAAQLGAAARLNEVRHRHWLARGRLALAFGDLEAAQSHLEAAEADYGGGPAPEARPLDAVWAQLWLAQGRLTAVQAWAQAQSLTPDDPLSYPQAFSHTVLARLLLAQEKWEAAAELLARLLTTAKAEGRIENIIELLLLQGALAQARGEMEESFKHVSTALERAEPEEIRYPFMLEKRWLLPALQEMTSRGLLTTFGSGLLHSLRRPQPAATSAISQPLIEPLSERELEVLGLVAQGLSNQEIGNRLYLSINTVKGHNRRIYAKLQVERRTEAVARAQELGLI